VHRDSSNEYLINGSQVRLKDIIELLAGAHIGASGHHIISQGEADKILNANIKERREMIEDALGLKIYQYKKLESVRKLDKTQENIKSVESLRKEIAPHLKFLKKQVEKVEKVFEMKKSLIVLYKEYFKREETYLKYQRTHLENQKAGPARQMKQLEEELANAKQILADSKNKDAKSDEIIRLEQEIKIARAEKETVARESGRIEGEISSIERLVKKERERQASEEQKTVYLRDVESLIKRVDVEIQTAEGKEVISEIKGVFSKIRGLIFGFLSQNKTADSSTSIADSEEEIKKLRHQKNELEEKLKHIAGQETHLNAEYQKLRHEIEKEKDSNRDAEKNVFRIMAVQNELHGILNGLKSLEEKLVFEEEAFKRELSEAHVLAGREALDFHAYEVVVDGAVVHADHIIHEPRAAQDDRRKNIEKIKIRIEDSGGGNSEDIMKEYREVEERDTFLGKEMEDLEKSAAALNQLILELDVRLDQEFKQGILKINTQFSHYFALMFGGGNASLNVIREKKRKRKDSDLSLLDDDAARAAMEEEEEEEEGVGIEVNLPRKKIKGLEMLSGGERALTSIALLFAISQVNPPPFIILDETDAALDEANSRKYGDMIANLSKYSQLILITHNRETMSRAGVLYGVTMGADGASKLLSIAFEEAVMVAK
jgi:chromosome segregation protein